MSRRAGEAGEDTAARGLAGRTVIVTGASSGLGATPARLLATTGCRLGLCARDGRRLTEFAARLSDNLALPCTAAARTSPTEPYWPGSSQTLAAGSAQWTA